MTELKKLDELLSAKLGPNKKIKNVEITKPSQNGVGGIMLKLKLLVEDQDGKEEVIHLIAKKIPEDEATRETFDIQNTFKKEIAFYDEILPLLKDFQKEEGITDTLDCFAEFYGARYNLNGKIGIVDENAVLLLEDLSVKGFKNQNLLVGFDLDCFKKTLKDLATFNGVTIALKLQKPELFETKIKPWFHTITFDDDGTIQMLRDLEKMFSENPETAPLAKKATAFAGKKIASPREPYATLVHFDLWVNNTMQIMENDKVIRNVFVDFQLFDYRSCATDVFFHIWTCAQDYVVRNHIDYLLKYYHDNLVETIKQFNVDTSQFSYEKFLEEIYRECDFEYGHSLIFVTFVKTAVKMPSKPIGELNLDFDKIPQAAKDYMYFMLTECNKRGWVQ